jgi:iron complex outermembrane receptor protein
MSRAGIVASTDLAAVTPGLSFPTQGAFAQPVVRGVGSTLTGPGADPNVAIYIDGVYQPNQSANIFNFNSVEQVEVLKGPQGTLFGRNATGGAILIRTLNPSYTPEGRASLSYGRFNDLKLNFYGSAPIISDMAAANIAVAYRAEDSFTRNIAGPAIGGLKEFAARGKLLIEPTDNLNFVLTGNYSHIDNPRQLAFAPYRGNNTQNLRNPALPRPGRAFEVALNEPTDFITRNTGVSLKGELSLGLGTVSSITAYGDIKNSLGLDGDNSAAATSYIAYTDTQKTFSQELVFASEKFGMFSFVAGAFYYDDSATRDLRNSLRETTPLTRQTVAGVDTKAYAIFSEVTLDLAERLHLTGGVRYSHEKKTAFGVRTISLLGTLDESASFSGVTPRAVVRYELNDSSNVYASYSQGFKSGAFNAINLERVPVKEETVTAYEVGYKTGRRGLTFNASAFYYDYSNIQVQSSITTGVLLLTNAASAEIYGADMDFSIPISQGLSIDGGAAYTHGRYTRFPGAPIVTPTATGNVQSFGDSSGAPTVRTPEFTANTTITFERDVSFGRFSASATGSYNSGFNWAPDERVKQSAYFLLNSEVSIATPDDRFRLTLWGRNLTDKVIASYQNQNTSGDQVVYERPRSYGVTLGARF